MEEQNGSADVLTKVLCKYAWFYNVPKGFVLVRRSCFGNYRMGGKITNITELDVKVSIRIINLTDDQLSYYINKYSGSVESKQQRLYNFLLEEKAARQQEVLTNNKVDRSMDLKKETINIDIPKVEVDLTTYEQKYGIKFRVPFEDVTMIPTTELPLDTGLIQYTDEVRQYEVEIDTDYKYVIEDPVLFVEKRETLRVVGKNVHKEIGDLLDDMIRSYIKSIGIESFLVMKNNNLLLENAMELLEIRQKYGVQITKFLIKDINLPKKIAEANEASEVAEKEAQAEAIKARSAAEAEAAAVNAAVAAIAKEQNISFEEARKFYLDAKRSTVQTHGGMNISVGAPQPAPQAAPQPEPQPAPQQNTAESLLRDLSIVDDEGYLNRADSQFIAQKKGVQLEPGTVYHASELSTIEAFEIASRHRLSNPQNTQQSTTTAYTEDQIKQFAADGLCDEDGYLSRADSQLISQKRGVQLAPGKVLHVNDLTQNDFDMLRQKNNIK